MVKARIKIIESVAPTRPVISCKHEQLDEQGFCPCCNMSILQVTHKSEWGERYTKAKAEKTILKDLENCDIPDEVKIKANNVFITIGPATHRSKKRQQLIFFCLFAAYRELGIHIDPKSIASMIGMKVGGMTKSLSMFSETQTGYRVNRRTSSCLDLIPDYCEKIGISTDAIPCIQSLANNLLDKCPSLNERFPQTVAAGVLRYYMFINGIKLDEAEFARQVCLSEATINLIHRQIQQVDNS